MGLYKPIFGSLSLWLNQTQMRFRSMKKSTPLITVLYIAKDKIIKISLRNFEVCIKK
jgi:hypothetical protein